MATDVVTVPAPLPLGDLIRDYFLGPSSKHSCYPVLGSEGQFLGMITESNLLEHWLAVGTAGAYSPSARRSPDHCIRPDESAPMVAHPDDSCREMAERLAESVERSLPVVSPQDPNPAPRNPGCRRFAQGAAVGSRGGGKARAVLRPAADSPTERRRSRPRAVHEGPADGFGQLIGLIMNEQIAEILGRTVLIAVIASISLVGRSSRPTSADVI